jgi:hypothetical protein
VQAWRNLVRDYSIVYPKRSGGGSGRKGRSRFPKGMTERKARTKAKAKEEADP